MHSQTGDIPEVVLNRLKENLQKRGFLDFLDPNLERNLYGEPALICPTCGRKSFGATRFKDHLLIHTDDKPFKCSECNYNTCTNAKLMKHMKTHEKPIVVTTRSSFSNKEKTMLEKNGFIRHLTPEIRRNQEGELEFNCQDCERQIFGNKTLRKHLDSVHSEKKFKCDSCDYSTVRPKDLLRHKLIHKEDRNFVCKVCNMSFKSLEYLKLHEKVHKTSGITTCLDCFEEFTDEYMLKMHIQAQHPGYKKFECSVCGKRYRTKIELTGHESTHTGTEPFHCTLCDKKYHLKATYDQHMEFHERKQDHECYFCKEVLPDYTTFNIHRSKHTEFFRDGSKIYHCPHCDQQHVAYSYFVTHLKCVHDKQTILLFSYEPLFKCDICQKEFTSKKSMKHHAKGHEKTEDHECYICKQKFEDSVLYHLHQKSHTEYYDKESKKYKCCDKIFACFSVLVDHLRGQTHDGLYKCNLCEKGFKMESALRNHLKLHKKKHNFECYFCKAVLPDYILFQKHCYGHKELYNKDESTFVCSHCGAKKKKWSHLIKHDRAAHNGDTPFNCDLCGTKLSCAASLRNHILSKQHQASVKEADKKLRKEDTIEKFTSSLKVDTINENDFEQVEQETNKPGQSHLPMTVAVFRDSKRNGKGLKIIWTKTVEFDMLTLASTDPNCFICLLGSLNLETAKMELVEVSNSLYQLKITILSLGTRQRQLDREVFDSIRELEKFLLQTTKNEDSIHFIREALSDYLAQLSVEFGTQVVICNVTPN